MTGYTDQPGILGYGASSFLGTSTTPTKRKVFFSFHFDDKERVDNVRHTWKIGHPDTPLTPSFYDSSLWESRKAEGDNAVKNLIRDGVCYTSAVCVLVGSHTWSRRWVKYEMTRAVIDNRGLLAVHINGIPHHQTSIADSLGLSPLHILGLYKHPNGNYYLYEEQWVVKNLITGEGAREWHPYQDHTHPVSLPAYLNAPQEGFIMPLSNGAQEYNYALQSGAINIGTWIDYAAQQVGR